MNICANNWKIKTLSQVLASLPKEASKLGTNSQRVRKSGQRPPINYLIVAHKVVLLHQKTTARIATLSQGNTVSIPAQFRLYLFLNTEDIIQVLSIQNWTLFLGDKSNEDGWVKLSLYSGKGFLLKQFMCLPKLEVFGSLFYLVFLAVEGNFVTLYLA